MLVREFLFPRFLPANFLSPLPENAKGGGKKEGGGKTSRGDPPRKTVSDPHHLGTFCPPPYGICLSKSLRSAQNFPQLTSSETAFGGSQKIVSDGPSSRGFAFRYVLPPPPLALPSPLSVSSIMLSIRTTRLKPKQVGLGH